MTHKRLSLVVCLFVGLIFLPGGASARKSPHLADEMLMIEGSGPEIASYEPQTINYTDSRVMIDFDGDHLADLPIGSPLDDLAAAVDAGTIHVVYSGSKGLVPKGNKQFLIDGIAVGDGSGNSLAVGDFNGDKLSDMAVGISGFDSQFGTDTGAVLLYIAKKSGGFDQTQTFVGEQPGERLGYAVTSGDFDGNGKFDLAASAVGHDFGSKLDVGLIYTWRATDSGLVRDQDWHLGSPGILGKNVAKTFFGTSLFSADFNYDKKWDLGIGSPFGRGGKGFVSFIYGSSNFLKADGNQRVYLKGTDKASFGFSLGACYCNSDRYADPIIGAPDYRNGEGAVFRLFSGPSGVTLADSQFLQSEPPQEGSRFGFAAVAAGVDMRWMGAFSAPSEDVTIDSKTVQDGGAIYTYNIHPDGFLEFSARLLGQQVARNDGDQLGRSLATTIDEKRFSLVADMPGADIQGFADAGAVLTWKSPYSAVQLDFKFHKKFDLGNLKGTPEAGGAFGLGLPRTFVYEF